MFLFLPPDVLSLIWSQLCLRDVTRARQVGLSHQFCIGAKGLHSKVCRYFLQHIGADKQLWMSLLGRESESRGIPLNPYHCALDTATATYVESWLRTTISYRSAYEIASAASTISTTVGSRITWLKLLRGRWCLVASSDESRSRLMLFDSLDSNSHLLCEMLLPGPVMDGQCDDTGDGICLAISVGTRSIASCF